MTEAIRLDRTKPYSECRGERTPDDPHYKVHFFQGYKVGKKTILLPFDVAGDLVPDDGKTVPYAGIVEGKPVTFHPLYTDEMRKLVKKLEEAAPEPEPEDDEPMIVGSDDPEGTAKGLDLAAILRGEIPAPSINVIRNAMKAQHGLNPKGMKEVVDFLVLELPVVSADQLAEKFRHHLPK